METGVSQLQVRSCGTAFHAAELRQDDINVQRIKRQL